MLTHTACTQTPNSGKNNKNAFSVSRPQENALKNAFGRAAGNPLEWTGDSKKERRAGVSGLLDDCKTFLGHSTKHLGESLDGFKK